MIRTLAIAVLAPVTLAAAPAAAQSAPRAPSLMAPPPMAAASRQAMPYLMLTGESDVFEITTAQIALMKSGDPAVREFGTMLIDHHSRTTNRTIAAARAGGVTAPPPVLNAPKRAMIDALMAASPAEFDRIFLSQQVPAHEEALALQQGYAANGDTATLRTTAAGAVPIVESHLETARRLLAAR